MPPDIPWKIQFNFYWNPWWSNKFHLEALIIVYIYFLSFCSICFRLKNNGYSYRNFIKLTPEEGWSAQLKIVRKRFSIHIVSSFAVAFGLVVYLFSIFLFLADEISFLEIKRWQPTRFSSTVFAVYFSSNKTWKSWSTFSSFNGMSILAILIKRREETVSVPKNSLQ